MLEADRDATPATTTRPATPATPASYPIHGDAWALLEWEEKYDVIAAKFTYIAIFPRLCHRHPNHLIK